jgi:uncharacterized Zn-binding protein involved in type VI secretion
MSALEAARFGDEIGHTCAMSGLLTGLFVGLALVAAAVVIVGTGGVGAVFIGAAISGVAGLGMAGMSIGATIPSTPKGPINSGSPDTFLGMGMRKAARAVADTVLCLDHKLKHIAQGSVDVFINNMHAARRTDGMECSAIIRDGQPDVFFGGPTGTYMDMSPEVPGWVVTTLKWAAWIGAGIATGGAIFTVGLGAALGGLAGSLLLGYAGSELGGDIGEALGGATGRAIGAAVGGLAGAIVGGGLGAKFGGALEARLPTETLARMPGATPAHIEARQTVAREFYNNSPDFIVNGAPNTGRIEAHMSGIDFTRPVSVRTFNEPTTLAQYQSPGGPRGNYIAEPSTPANQLGIGALGRDPAGVVGPKVVQSYEVPAGTRALQSTASPKNDTWSAPSTQSAPGGGQQLFVGESSVLRPQGGQVAADPALLQPGGAFSPTASPGTGGVPVRGDGVFLPPSVAGTGAAIGAGGQIPDPDPDP